MLFAGCAGALVADDASAESVSSANIILSESKVAEGDELTATISFTEQDTEIFRKVVYNAKLVDSDDKTQSGAVSSSTGTFTTATASKDLTVTAPKTAGTYTLVVEFTETIHTADGDKEKEPVVVKKKIKVCEPVVLSVTVENNGNLNINDAVVYFYVDGEKIEDSKTTLTVEVGKSKELTYNYFDKDMKSGKHTYSVQPADQAYLINGLGEEHSFYYDQSTDDYLVWIMGVIFVVVLIVAVIIFRKPVKNYGKPKARR